jgi:hypothetical protein
VQDQIAAVLQSWERHKQTGDSNAELEAAINYLAHKANVKTFGRVGEVVAFEPFAHYVIDPIEGKAPELVTIVTFGVRAEREDGSLRVISRALVKNGEVL